MPSILDLKSKWNKEKIPYTKKEVGDGVQNFVKEVLACPEIFNLKKGLNSAPLEKRKNEFKEEEVKKAARRADVVIFVNPEIVIPMEIERYQNIQAGERQIIQYQLDWNEHSNRRYGILTDGYTWRFYNNNEYREFVLNDIFDKTNEFLEFWNEYTKPEFYYLAFFEKKGQQSLLKKSETLHVEEYRQLFFEDITKLIKSFKNKLKLEGYLKSFDKKEREKKSIELTYAYIIQFILYKTLVDNEFGKFEQEFKDIRQTIYGCLKSEQYGKILGVIDGVSQMISKDIYRPFAKEQEFITQKLLDLIHQPKNELHDVSPWLDIIVFIKKYNFANVRNEIFGYIYENYLKALDEDEKKGQYFTDSAVVNFMLKQIGYVPEEIDRRLKNKPEDNYISIVDPSCGSGTFLYSAVNQIVESVPNGSEKASKKIEELVNNNVYGLDIEEFPLYLAEMNILMRMLPLIINEKYNNPIDKKIKAFKTKDSISEFIDSGLKNTIHDIDVAGGQRALFDSKKLDLGYDSFMRDEDDLSDMKKSMRPPRRRFDYVIGNPPYISYNECSRQGVLIVKLIQSKKVLMSDIYGMNLNTVPGRIKAYSPKPNLYSFFIALGLTLLKDNGKLCYIVPQTMLSANDLDVLRYHLAKYITIDKIVNFSGKMFIERGIKQKGTIPTSSLIFVARRKVPGNLHGVEIINYDNSNDNIEQCLKNITNNIKTNKQKILQTKLLENFLNWNFIKWKKPFCDFYDYYKFNSKDISSFRSKLDPEDDFFFDGGVIVDEKQIISDSGTDCYEVFDYKCNDWSLYTVSKSNKYYSKTSTIKFPGGSQGIATYQRKYKILWRTRFANIFQFTDRDILLVNNQSLTVTSNNKNELLYYFALLNSKINKLILEKNLKQENEVSYFIPLRAIKTIVRTPKITESNHSIKKEIIRNAEEILNLEKDKLSDLVDFKKVLIQKFDDIKTEKNKLILIKDDKNIKLEIKSNAGLVKKAISGLASNDRLRLEKNKISLGELKELPVIDFELRDKVKDYIDDLVFALYFNVLVKEVGLNKAKKIKKMCEESKFYKVVGSNIIKKNE